MSVLISPESKYGKEIWKWEHHDGEGHPSDPTIRGVRPNGFKPYPAMLYLVTQKNPWVYESKVVNDDHEQRNFESRGYVAGGLGAACDAFDAKQQDLAVLAAARNYADRNMGEKAKAERDAAEQSSSSHLGEIPVTPLKRKPGRPPKTPPV